MNMLLDRPVRITGEHVDGDKLFVVDAKYPPIVPSIEITVYKVRG